MDKQQTRYIRITKPCEEGWYDNIEFKDSIWEVYESADGDWALVRDKGKFPSRYIEKSDCEPYEFPMLQTAGITKETEKAAALWANTGIPDSKLEEIGYRSVCYKSFMEGARHQAKAAPVQEVHTITTQQLKELMDSPERFMSDMLKEWFPTVFQKERTYKIGQRFEIDGEPYILADGMQEYCSLICLNDGKMWSSAVHVKNTDKITEEEMQEIAAHREFKPLE